MSDTPRLRSAFPQTPRRTWATGSQSDTPVFARRPATPKVATPAPVSKLKSLTSMNAVPARDRTSDDATDPPLIPFDVCDAPTQRLYVVAFYLALHAYRFYEYWTSTDTLDATWLFMKFVLLDGVFLFGLPAMRIPWLEWAFPTTLAVFLLHAVMDAFLMFKIPIPVGTWLSALVKLAYDRELAISERRVKPYDILHNSSLILGKQTVHILPEGSAVLNNGKLPFCIGDSEQSVSLPLRINQTTPIHLELLRFDLETGNSEIITISSKQAKQLKRQAEKTQGLSKSDTLTPRELSIPVKKTGAYFLRRVVDDSKLEVRRRSFDTLVVKCPTARIVPSPINRCKGELSNLTFEVEGTPPLKVKYSRKFQNVNHGVSFQSIQPEGFYSPLVTKTGLGHIVDPQNPVVDWAQSRRIQVPLNESLSQPGEWVYSIEEVHDICGNVAEFSSPEDESASPPSPSSSQLQLFQVHERPRISLGGCNAQRPLQAPKNHAIRLPVRFYGGRRSIDDIPYTITYTYSNESASFDNPATTETHEMVLANPNDGPLIRKPGWYSLSTINSRTCSGEVFEPASCNLHNPPPPSLAYTTEKLYDKCANSSVGLMVYLDLIGTPPFRIQYNVESSKETRTRSELLSVDSLRASFNLTPPEAGHYRYEFLDISDRLYGPQSLKDKLPALEQDVKPPAFASFDNAASPQRVCYGDAVSVPVKFHGEAPWVLEYEILHNSKRIKMELHSEKDHNILRSDRFMNGGQYFLGLTSVKDKTNCKKPLNETLSIDVRARKPRAAFGQIDRRRSILALEDRAVNVPLRLEGLMPFGLAFKNLDNPEMPPIRKTFYFANDQVQLQQRGRYEITNVRDTQCPGVIDQRAKDFEIQWIPRPRIVSVDGGRLEPSLEPKTLYRGEVCEMDEDQMDLRFEGKAPFTLKYEEHCKPNTGSNSVSSRSVTAALNSVAVRMDTSRPGDYAYKFVELGDGLYDHDRRSQNKLTVSQRVNPRPEARFDQPNRVYGFCKEGDSDEVIPINLEGVPPFSLEIGIKHHANTKPEVVTIPNINSHKYDLPLPRRYLSLGQHAVTIRKIRDARCHRFTEYDGSSVRVVVSDVPSIVPLESHSHFCVGERISFSLSGHAPFNVFYTFNNLQRKASVQGTNFRRIAEQPGDFTITSVSDSASGKCKAHKDITKVIHQLPSVKVSQGMDAWTEIHEGGEASIIFEFWGTPPFEFTYTRSSLPIKGKKARILDTKHDISYEHTKIIKTSDEGTYEVISIKDKYCSFSTQNIEDEGNRS